MIQRFLRKVFSGDLFRTAKSKVIPLKSHRIIRASISSCATKTCETLQQQGYAAYVVGGVGMTYLGNGRIVIAPIRSGLGLRLGASIGSLKFTTEKTWLPF